MKQPISRQSSKLHEQRMLASKLATTAVEEYVRRLSLGEHAVLFYDDTKTLAKVFTAYFNGGVETNEATIFVGPSQIYDKLFQTPSIERRSKTRPGHVARVELGDFFLDRGQMNTKGALQSITNLIDDRGRSGFLGLRILGLTGMLTEHVERADILEFERIMGTRFRMSFSAICAYNTHEWLNDEQLELLTQLLKCHGHGVFQGIAFPT